MSVVLRSVLAAVILLAPPIGAPRLSLEDGRAPAGGALRATLRSAPAFRPAPAWLEHAVCEQGAAELGERCAAVAAAVFEEAEAARLDPLLVLAIIEVESSWDPLAVSRADARGLMQLLRPTLESEAAVSPLDSVDAHDPVVNVRAGVRFFARLVRQFSEHDLAMVAYNAGPGRVRRYLRSEEGIPERFWEYPRAIRRAEARLRARVNAPPRMVAALEAGPVAE